MKTIFAMLLILLSSVLMYSCGDDGSSLTAEDVKGSWFTENTQTTENSCNLSDDFLSDTKKTYYYSFEPDGDNLKMYECETARCVAMLGTIGTYKFKDTININVDDKIIDFNDKGYDCKLTINYKKFTFIFNSSDSGKKEVDTTITKSGPDCDSLRAKAEADDDQGAKDIAKMLGDNPCSLGIKSDLKKQ